MKTCSKCKIETNSFSPSKAAKDGLKSWCKECCNNLMKYFHKTKKGLISQIYGSQESGSKKRGHRKPSYTRKELREWCFSQKKFHELYNNWKESGYDKWLVPSCDRIDDGVGYFLDNIQLMTWKENFDKGVASRSAKVVQYNLKGDKLKVYNSQAEAGRMTEISQGNIFSCCAGKRKTAGGYIWKYDL